MSPRACDENNNDLCSQGKYGNDDDQVIVLSEELISGVDLITSQQLEGKFHESEIESESFYERSQSTESSSFSGSFSSELSHPNLSDFKRASENLFQNVETPCSASEDSPASETTKVTGGLTDKSENWKILLDRSVSNYNPTFLQRIVLVMGGKKSKKVLRSETLKFYELKIKLSFVKDSESHFTCCAGISHNTESMFQLLASGQGKTQKAAKNSVNKKLFRSLLETNLTVKRAAKVKIGMPEVNTDLSIIADQKKNEPLKLEPIAKDNVGYVMLCKMGWCEGTGLGKFGQGVIEPVEIRLNSSVNRSGLGWGCGWHGEPNRITMGKTCKFLRNYIKYSPNKPLVFPKDTDTQDCKLLEAAFRVVSKELKVHGMFQCKSLNGHLVIRRSFNFADVFNEIKYTGQVIDQFEVLSMGTYGSNISTFTTPEKPSYAGQAPPIEQNSSIDTSAHLSLSEKSREQRETEGTFESSLESEQRSGIEQSGDMKTSRSDPNGGSHGSPATVTALKETAVFAERLVILAGKKLRLDNPTLRGNRLTKKLQVKGKTNLKGFRCSYQISRKGLNDYHLIATAEGKTDSQNSARTAAERAAFEKLTNTNIIVKRVPIEPPEVTHELMHLTDRKASKMSLKNFCEIIETFIKSNPEEPLVFPNDLSQNVQNLLAKAFKTVCARLNVKEKFQSKYRKKHFIISRSFDLVDVFDEAKYVGQQIDEYQVVSMGIFAVIDPSGDTSQKVVSKLPFLLRDYPNENVEVSRRLELLDETDDFDGGKSKNFQTGTLMGFETGFSTLNKHKDFSAGFEESSQLTLESDVESYQTSLSSEIGAIRNGNGKVSVDMNCFHLLEPCSRHLLPLIPKMDANLLQRAVVLFGTDEEFTLMQTLKLNGLQERMRVVQSANGNFLHYFEVSRRDERDFHLVVSFETPYPKVTGLFMKKRALEKLSQTNIIVKHVNVIPPNHELAFSCLSNGLYTSNYILKKLRGILKMYVKSDNKKPLVLRSHLIRGDNLLFTKVLKQVSEELDLLGNFSFREVGNYFLFYQNFDGIEVFDEAKFIGQFIGEFQVMSMGLFSPNY